MDTKLYNRIVDHAQEITLSGNLPWEGVIDSAEILQNELEKAAEE